MVVTGLGRDQPTVSITNGREAKLKTLIRRYARRMKVDLDIVLAVLAQGLLAALLRRRDLESDQPRRRRLACLHAAIAEAQRQLELSDLWRR